MNKIATFATFFVFSTLLASQSLVDVAKQERERREKYKGKNVKVVTNADLLKIRKTPAIVIAALPPGEETAAEPAAPPPAETPAAAGFTEGQPAEGAEGEAEGPSFATGILPDTALVENPELALGPPDGRYAEIPLYGVLVLEFSARNGPGEDIAVYANRRATSLESVLPGEVDEPLWNDLMTYGVLGLDADGEWQAIGRGSGMGSRERFDLGELESVENIMIIFRYYNEPQAGFKQTKEIVGDYFIGIDAVEAIR
jgi:hypothetical protein